MPKVIIYRIYIFIFLNSITFSLYSQLHTDFESNITNGCSPLVVQFDNTSTGNPVNYYWTFGNGGTSTQRSPGAIYITPGIYTVTLVISDNINTDTIIKTAYISVFAKPEVMFSGTNVNGCVPLNVSFTDNTVCESAPINEWIWDFGNGYTSSLQNPTHLYNSSGDFNVSLITRDTNGCSGSYQVHAFVHSSYGPNVLFEPASPVFLCNIPASISFSNHSSQVNPCPPYTYLWDFGDSTTSTDINPTHSFTNSGNYNVRLTVADVNNCSASRIRNSWINVSDYILYFSSVNVRGCEPLTVNFTNLSNQHRAWQTVTWDFGDGTTLSGPANRPDMNATSHVYSAGSYTVKLSYFGTNDSCYFEYISPLTVLSYPAPVAGFYAVNRYSCNDSLTVIFTDASQNAVGWVWDFGDGSTSTNRNPLHTYLNFGSYNVSLIVSSPNGCSDTVTKNSYVVIRPLNIDINAVQRSGCIPFTVFFSAYNDTISQVNSYEWHFGNGMNGTGENASATYTDTGFYDVTLIATTTDGCKDTIARHSFIHATEKPVAGFYTSDTVLCLSEMPVTFKNTSSSDATHFIWNFGDNSQLATTNHDSVSHLYGSNPGHYTVTLYAFNNGCVDSLVRRYYITILSPRSMFRIVLDTCNNDSVRFIDLSAIRNSIFYRHWNFGTGNPADTSNLMNPSFLYTSFDTFTVSLSCNAINYIYDSTHVPPMIVDTIVCVHQSSKELNLINFKDSGMISTTVVRGCNPLRVNLVCSTPYGVSWRWDFGNGQTSVNQNPVNVYNHPGTYYVSCHSTTSFGCVYHFDSTIKIVVYGPDVGFTVSPPSGCLPLTVLFNDTSVSLYPISSKFWSFGDGFDTTINSNSVSHYYDRLLTYPPSRQADGYRAGLTLTDTAGCVGSFTGTILYSHPIPDFSVQTIHRCSTDSLIFLPVSNSSAGYPPFTFSWDFGNGQTSVRQGPVYQNFNNGNYNVTLYITDGNGCLDSLSKPVNVNITSATAGFTATPTNQSCPPLHVFFTNASIPGSTGGIIAYLWDFGDGTRSTLINPEKTYLTPGVFSIRLYIVDSTGCVSSILMPNLISLNGPTGSYTIGRRNSCVGSIVSLTSSSPNATSFLWDTGDGFLINGQNISHIYNYPGQFVPILILTDAGGCVRVLPPVDTVFVFPVPLADFSADNACENDTLHFSNNSFMGDTSGNSRIVDYWWYFNDNTLSTLENPEHIYYTHGNKPVMLIVESNHLCRDTALRYVRINSLPVAGFTFNEACLNFPTVFSNTSVIDTGNMTSWYWDYGDGNNSSLIEDQNLYENEGEYNVSLFVISDMGCKDTLIQTVSVNPLPEVYFSTDMNIGCKPLFANFVDMSTIHTGSLSVWVWDFGNSLTSSLQNPSTIYTIPGTYHVTLTVYSDHQCETTFTQENIITIHPDPIAGFIAKPSIVDIYYPDILLIDSSSADVTGWLWDFGDTTGSILENPLHSYLYADTFLIRQVVKNQYGCTDTSYQFIIVKPGFEFYIPNAFTPNGDDANETFNGKGIGITKYKMAIYNQWGGLIFETNNLSRCWDGKSKDGINLPQDTYVYVVQLKTVFGELKKYTGKVLLIR